MGAEGLQPVDELNVTAGAVPQGVVLMRRQSGILNKERT